MAAGGQAIPLDMTREYTDDELLKLTRSAGGLRTQFNVLGNTLASTARYVDSMAKPTEASLETLRGYIAKYEEAQERLLLTNQICLVNEETADRQRVLEDRINTITAEFTANLAAARDLLGVAEGKIAALHPVPAAGAGAAAVGAAARDEISLGLKPKDLLSLSMNPMELKNWWDSFNTWYTDQRMDARPLTSQRAWLYTVLESTLHSKLANHVVVDTPIYGVNSCKEFLDSKFQHVYPLIQRRIYFFEMKQEDNQKFTDFTEAIDIHADAAALDEMTTDTHKAFRAICGCKNKKLRERLLAIDPLTFDAVKQAGENFEAQEYMEKSIQPAARAAKMTGTTKKGKRSKSHSAKMITRADLKGRCYRCGSKDHSNDECKKKVHCNKCNKNNHDTSVCLAAYYASQRSKSKGRSKSKDRSKSKGRKTREESPSPEREERAERGREPAKEKDTATAKSLLVHGVRSLTVEHEVNSLNVYKPTPMVSLCFSKGQHKFWYTCTPDTGATATVVAQNILDRHGIKYEPTSHRLKTANKEDMRVSGQIRFRVSTDGSRNGNYVDALVSPDVSDEIMISWHALVDMRLITLNFPDITRMIRRGPDSFERILEDYSDVFTDSLGDIGAKTLAGPPMKIHLKENINKLPKKFSTARTIPVHLRDAADEQIRNLLDAGVIVPVTVPTRFTSSGHWVPKPGGGARLVTDYKDANEFVERPVHPFPSSMEIIQSIKPDSTVFASFDLKHGYWQIPLEEESSYLTTFIVPQGRFRYTRAPMGLNASGDEFCQRTDLAIEGLEGVVKLVDDVLIQAPDENVLHDRIRAFLDRAREHSMLLGKGKSKIGTSIKFAGHIIGRDGVKPDEDKVAALRHFPVPTNVTALKSFLGLANQLAYFVPDFAHITAPLRQLLKKDVHFGWDPSIHGVAFDRAIEVLTSDVLVKPYDTGLSTELLTDASRTCGLGYMLLQREADGKPRVVTCGSRSLLPAETRYATIELEALAIQWAVDKCSFYLKGCPTFQVLTDHRPLVGIFAKDLMDIPNGRLLRIREKLAGYNFKLGWVPGKVHHIADALSRAPVFDPAEEDYDEELLDPHCHFANIIHNCNAVMGKVNTPRLSGFFQAADTDDDYLAVVSALEDGLTLRDLPHDHPGREYKHVWSQLSLVGTGSSPNEMKLIVYDGSRIVVPKACRKDIIQKLHLSHSGMVKTKRAARQWYYWLGLNNDIEMAVARCTACAEMLPSQPSEPEAIELATEPMDAVGLDLFQIGTDHYLVMVDRYSGYPFVKKLTRLATEDILKVLRIWFLDEGKPVRIRTDGGPQFRGPFAKYCEDEKITHELSSAYNPKSNGLAESAVKQVSRLLRKCKETGDDFDLAFAEWRNTPSEHGPPLSPAELFKKRKLRGALPSLADQSGDTERVLVKEGVTYKDLKPDTFVMVQNVATKKWSERAFVVKKRDSGSYLLKSYPEERVMIRSRRYIKTAKELKTDDLEVERYAGVSGKEDHFQDSEAHPGAVPTDMKKEDLPKKQDPKHTRSSSDRERENKSGCEPAPHARPKLSVSRPASAPALDSDQSRPEPRRSERLKKKRELKFGPDHIFGPLPPCPKQAKVKPQTILRPTRSSHYDRGPVNLLRRIVCSNGMGNSSSSSSDDEKGEKVSSPTVNNQPTSTVENSSGFHLLELHGGTASLTAGLLAIIGVLACATTWGWSRLKRYFTRQTSERDLKSTWRELRSSIRRRREADIDRSRSGDIEMQATTSAASAAPIFRPMAMMPPYWSPNMAYSGPSAMMWSPNESYGSWSGMPPPRGLPSSRSSMRRHDRDFYDCQSVSGSRFESADESEEAAGATGGARPKQQTGARSHPLET